MRPHFVTIGAHTINVTAIARIFISYPVGLPSISATISFADGWSFNVHGDEAHRFLAFMAAPPPAYPPAIDQREWDWTVLP